MKVHIRTMNKSYNLSSLIIFLVASAGVHCLKLIGLSVPSWVKRGDGVWLNCTLEYEEDVLYSIKWYKNDVEFYRYMPRDIEKNQIYEYSGVYVNLSESDKGQVNLYKTDLDTEGSFRCEASNDGPTFQTVDGVKELKIYELPENNLTIYGLLPSYDVGDVINATCEAGPSKPAAKLTWLIDDEPITSFEESHSVTKNEDGLESSSSNLSFVLSEDYGYKNAINLKCIATVSIYDSTSNEELIMDDKNSTVKTELNATEGPIITGGQPTYRRGDLLDVNCTSPKSSPPPKLQWYINGVKAPPEQIISYPNDLSNESQTTVLGLRFHVESIHFDYKIKCTSIVSRVIDTRSEVKVVENRRSQFGFENRGADSVIANDISGSANHILPRAEALLLLLLLPFL